MNFAISNQFRLFQLRFRFSLKLHFICNPSCSYVPAEGLADVLAQKCDWDVPNRRGVDDGVGVRTERDSEGVRRLSTASRWPDSRSSSAFGARTWAKDRDGGGSSTASVRHLNVECSRCRAWHWVDAGHRQKVKMLFSVVKVPLDARERSSCTSSYW